MLGQIRIVLVGTSHPGNVGGVARAMCNMGLATLTLVAPRCNPHDSEAYARASGADSLLDTISVHDDLGDAVGDCRLVVGASARSRTLPWPMLTPRQLSERLSSELSSPDARLALVFGREDTGLSNAELQRCHAHVHIPTNPDFASLNLAAAVQVLAYECRMACLMLESAGTSETSAPVENTLTVDTEEPLATHDELEHYFSHLEQTLIDIGFHDPATPRQLMARLRRLYQRTRLDRLELNILRGILTATQKRAGDNHDKTS
ncbi:RNA methyltransferase [Aidingimonas lacisalsi]|uniref:RNA methyltransferase n=1 Tax=Aidingimonas lacisalsi TaxID=2604086 RepID=UPI0011D1E11E|nr:RNA methyltransferase [Aidingimonas lacisalsi]